MKKKPTKKQIVLRELRKAFGNLQEEAKLIFVEAVNELLDDLEEQLRTQLDTFLIYAKMKETEKVYYSHRVLTEIEMKLLIMNSQSTINSVRELTKLFLKLELRDLEDEEEDEESNQMFLCRELRESISRLEEELKKLFGYYSVYAKMIKTDKVVYVNLYLSEPELRSISIDIDFEIDCIRELTSRLFGVE